jgi:protocatechuate 3,4-dioxygenase alpha subunit
MIAPDALGYLPETPSQTAGPYVHIGLIPRQAGFDAFPFDLGSRAPGSEVPGERVRVEGRVFDVTGGLVRDALVEAWQADSEGRYGTPGFPGFRRTGTDFETGVWAFDTVRPGPVPARGGKGFQAPHILLWIAARGLNSGLHTRLYFADREEANARDGVLRTIEHPARRRTLIAARTERDGAPVFSLDIRLAGEGETVFLDV